MGTYLHLNILNTCIQSVKIVNKFLFHGQTGFWGEH